MNKEQLVTKEEIKNSKKLPFAKIRVAAIEHRKSLEVKQDLKFVLFDSISNASYSEVIDEKGEETSANVFKIGVREVEPVFITVNNYTAEVNYVERCFRFDETPDIEVRENTKGISSKQAHEFADEYIQLNLPNKDFGEIFHKEVRFFATRNIELENGSVEQGHIFEIGFNDIKTLYISVDLYNGSVSRVSELFRYKDTE